MEENKQTEEAKEVKNEQTAETPKKDVASKVTEAVSQIDTDELKKNAASYWNWLVTSWKNPTEVKQTNKYAGLISLALESLFLIVGIGKYVNAIVEAASSSVASFFGDSSYESSGMGFGFYLTGFIVFFCSALAMVGIAYLFCGRDEKTNFLTFSNKVAHYSNVILIADALFILSGFVVASSSSVILLAMLLLAASWLEWNVSLVYAAQNENRMNKIYSGTLVMIANIIVLVITFRVIGSISDDKLQELIQSIFSN